VAWYALFVVSGKEEYVLEWLKVYLADCELKALIPKRILIEHRQGKKEIVLKKLFPGYVLINIDMDLEKYYIIKKIPCLLRILNSGEYYTRIAPEEMNYIFRLMGSRDVIDLSKVYFVNSKIVVKSGPLRGMEGLIKAVNKRKRRVKIVIQFMGSPKEFDVGIEIIDDINNQMMVGT